MTPCVSPILGVVVCPVSSALLDPRRVVDFSVSSVFPLFLGWSDNFQAPYMQNHIQVFNGFCSSSPPHSSVYTLCRQSVGWELQRTASQVCFSLAVLSWARNVTFLSFSFHSYDRYHLWPKRAVLRRIRKSYKWFSTGAWYKLNDLLLNEQMPPLHCHIIISRTLFLSDHIPTQKPQNYKQLL